jgi:hypothetical protein
MRLSGIFNFTSSSNYALASGLIVRLLSMACKVFGFPAYDELRIRHGICHVMLLDIVF